LPSNGAETNSCGNPRQRRCSFQSLGETYENRKDASKPRGVACRQVVRAAAVERQSSVPRAPHSRGASDNEAAPCLPLQPAHAKLSKSAFLPDIRERRRGGAGPAGTGSPRRRQRTGGSVRPLLCKGCTLRLLIRGQGAAHMARTLPPMAATNKCLAQNNKSGAGGKATKKREIRQPGL